MSLYGLVLSGGESSRMGRDKGSLIYEPNLVDQRTRCFELLSEVCEKVFVSIREAQTTITPIHLPTLLDQNFGEGPGNGILSANFFKPGHAWLVIACDFPFLDLETLKELVNQRDVSKSGCAFIDSEGRIEPLLTLWEPKAIESLAYDFSSKQYSPRKTLERLEITRLIPSHPQAVQNVNSPFHTLKTLN